MKRKLNLVLLVSAFMGFSVSAWGQQLVLHETNRPILSVLEKIEKQAKVSFLYSNQTISTALPVTINADGQSLEKVLTMIFRNQPISFSLKDGVVSLKPKADSQKYRTVTIEVRDELSNLPLSNVTIAMAGGRATSTNQSGIATVDVPFHVKELAISRLGYTIFMLAMDVSKEKYIVRMTTANNQLSEVVVNSGIINRKKDSFTGAATTISGEQLRNVGNMNIMESIRSLDPSIVMPENVNLGANPNALPQIELRGQSSVSLNDVQDRFSSDPNQPLIILNGFQTTLQKLADLDLNRVASISILKDAASTAIYGAQAANGVIVIETVRPKTGKINVNYTADFRVQAYDLGSYNLMDAAEKLDFEKKSGRFSNRFVDYSPTKDNLLLLDSLYNERLKNVKAGVNTYWLDKPLQTGFTNKHSLYLDGGTEVFQYGVGTNYQDVKGLMQGSGRQVWGGNIDLTYRTSKINISNQLFITGNKSQESPYGSFQQYAQLNPYWKYDWGDHPPKYIEVSALDYVGRDYKRINNPFYNASLNSYNQGKNLSIENNLAFNYDFHPDFRLTTTLQLGKESANNTIFISPNHTKFDNTNIYEKGSYVDERLETNKYQFNGMLTYNKIFADKHVVTANLRGEIHHLFRTFYKSEAVGFPDGVQGLPSFAYQQKPGAKPGYEEEKLRRVNMLFSANYVYDNRYLFDATYRLDGSTAFGSEKTYSPFWSVGAGVNLHNETFLKDVSWLDLLRIRGNIGYTGNQNFGSFQSTTVYGYDGASNIFGQGLVVSQLGNPQLAWQKTRQISLGLDLASFNNRLSVTLNAYDKFTDPLIVSLNLPSSTGTRVYPENIGALTIKGVELITRYAVWLDPVREINWTVGLQGNMYKGTYSGFGTTTANLNDYLYQQKSLQRYTDGNSPYDIWAVKSLGINPADGQEVFLKGDGSYTFQYDFKDVVKSGSTRPIAEGVLSSQFRIQGFNVGVYLRYKLGGDVFNTALYNKVENIQESQIDFNQDRRALYGRWQNPGDLSSFKGISLTSYTPMSSRFVQRENVLSGESFSLGYEFRKGKHQWVQAAGLQTLRLTAYANDIFRMSNVRTERGLTYPFARNISFSINARF